MKKTPFIFLCSSILLLWLAGCSKRIYRVAYPTLNDGKYDSEFPYKSSSAELEEITRTIKKLTAIAYYKSYVFSEKNPAVLSEIRDDSFKKKTVDTKFYNNPVIGTATVLLYKDRRVVLLTCAHVINFRDTIITYFKDPEIGLTKYIQSVAVKEKQSNFVADFPEHGELEILAQDRHTDLALLGQKFENVNPMMFPVFKYPFGLAKELEWGSFVYMIGFPKGYQMVTKGIVSQPNRDKKGSFIVDALFNKGFSGGVVLAVRDGVPNFELVGIASSVSADFKFTLNPPKDIGRGGYDPLLPYKGEIFIRFEKSINYGITFIISSESILKFLRKNQEPLLQKGYDIEPLL